jgi:AcrR family transcriptional regulator
MATAKKAGGRTAARRDLDQRIVDHAMVLAAEVGWDHLRLRQVAEDLGISLAELRACHRDLDAVADAWLGRALQAMLEPAEAGFADLPARERVYLMMMRWFEANAAHRAVVGQMLRAKLHPPHPHHWVPMVFSLSRLIQWVREAARLDAPGRRRQVEEIGLTLLFLATLSVWLGDDTAEEERTRRYLRRRLAQADWMLARVGPRRRLPEPAPGARAAS